MNFRRIALPLLFCLALLPAVGCDKATPVAPEGTTLTISASPAKIQSANGTSTITVVARRANGTPINPGTEVRFDTDLGTITPVAEVDRSGVATATLRGDGRIGTAMVRATIGGVAEAATIEVEVGTPARTITLQPSPTTLPPNGGRINLLALVRDSSGQPMANQGVNFSTELGQLASGGAIIRTNANGQARDTLIVDERDLANNPTSLTVTAQTTGADGDLIDATFEIQVQSDRPIAEFSFSRGSNAREVQFRNESTGLGTLSFVWDFGDGSSSTQRNPIHTYTADRQYTVTLTVVNESGVSDVATEVITIPLTGSGT